MIDGSDFWSDIFDWATDFCAFGNNSILSRKAPKIEAKDGQEPTVESLREEARQADARAKTEKPRALTSHDRKAIDKEFWDSM